MLASFGKSGTRRGSRHRSRGSRGQRRGTRPPRRRTYSRPPPMYWIQRRRARAGDPADKASGKLYPNSKLAEPDDSVQSTLGTGGERPHSLPI